MAASQLIRGSIEMPRRCLGGVPVLLYHGITTAEDPGIDSRERKYCVRSGLLRDHLRMIADGGHRVAMLGELWASPIAASDVKPPVVLTFDDGRVTDYDVAYPILLEAGVRAEFFVNTATIGTPGFLQWPQITEMQRAGMSFQSHGHDHVALVGLPQLVLEHQLRQPKYRLEDRLGRPVEFLAVPYGLVNGRVLEAAQREGYRAVCTSRDWPARPGARTINRVAVHATTDRDRFLRLLNRSPLAYARRLAKTTLSYLPKRILLRWSPTRLGVRVLETSA